MTEISTLKLETNNEQNTNESKLVKECEKIDFNELTKRFLAYTAMIWFAIFIGVSIFILMASLGRVWPSPGQNFFIISIIASMIVAAWKISEQIKKELAVEEKKGLPAETKNEDETEGLSPYAPWILVAVGIIILGLIFGF